MKILMIEDEYLVAEEIRFCLNRAGFSGIEHASTEEEALKCLSEAGWDAAVVDANLNGRGIEAVADALFHHGIPFVIVTGYGRKSLPARVARITVVEKPFRSKTLVDAVASLIPRDEQVTHSGTVARDIIAIGGSAGSLESLIQMLGSLPPDLPAAVFVVVHLSARSPNYIPDILRKRATMPVVQASEGQRIQTGTVYVAPPDRHLLIRDDHIHLSRGPKEGLQRPSINVTFRSVAAACRERVIGILLSGMLDDGAAGIWEIAKCNGVTIVQDPAEAPFPSMPLNALNDAIVHHTLPVSEITRVLMRLTKEEIIPTRRGEEMDRKLAQFSGFTCPECRGPLYENGQNPEFRCRVGHVLSLRTLFEEHTSTQERKLYEAIVALEEGADLAERVASTEDGANQGELRKEAEQLRQNADVIRKLVEGRTAPSAE